ncbi:ABC transporter permease [Candidatus Cardinium hertigii]|uniref:Macrolide export ATP-binding/permease protein MacB n=1 Tax=Candidatus Cardinium hertigii TaxID=247481 RepID=A0A2Z3L9R7_9BACT|nr:ABC transporter permease [Candidatus Cardinium hertigii]AWN82263.1 Macrolide export ATP-binding/permease protein MacB [Candidatus Cardinium hertigii]
MIDYQIFIEPYKSLRQHTIRTCFTGFGVLWAMLLLVLFQGISNGYYKGLTKSFSDFNKDVLNISINPSSAKRLKLTKTVATSLTQGLPFFECAVPVLETTSFLIHETEKEESSIIGIETNYAAIHDLKIVEGRFFTQRHIQAGLPICLLSKQTKMNLFGEEMAIGKSIWLHNTAVHVIGIVEIMGRKENENIALIPDTFFNTLFPTQTITKMVSVLKPKQDISSIQAKTKNYLNRQLQIQDKDTINIYIPYTKETKRFKILFLVIQGFTWFISGCLLLSGVVGVSNMMLVVVRERTKELAIRKVVGASTKHIVLLILLESIIIHVLAGMVGMGLGIGLLKWANQCLLPIMKLYDIAHVELKYATALAALAVLLIASCLAAIIPAKRALYIKPIDALNNE